MCQRRNAGRPQFTRPDDFIWRRKVTFEEAIQVSGSLTDDLMIDFVADLQEKSRRSVGVLTTAL